MSANTKPLGMCECRDVDPEDHVRGHHHGAGLGEPRCYEQAVRLVTVRVPVGMTSATVRLGFWPDGMPRQVPMCSECASHTERTTAMPPPDMGTVPRADGSRGGQE